MPAHLLTLSNAALDEALLEAATKEEAETVIHLVQAGADTETCVKDGDRPLHLASRKGHALVVKVRLKAKADVEAVNKNDVTPLHFASLKRNADSVEAPVCVCTRSANTNIEAECTTSCHRGDMRVQTPISRLNARTKTKTLLMTRRNM